MNYSKYYRGKVIVLSTLLIVLLSIQSFPIGYIHPVEAGKYGNIEPTTFELQLLDKINENRTDNGVGPLKLNATLWRVARAHSQDMIDYDFLGHKSSDEGQFSGATFMERVNNHAEYANTYVGECLAWKSWGIDVESTMSSWINSENHSKIILDANFKEIGIGLLDGEWDGWPGSGLHTVVFGGGGLSVDLAVESVYIEFDPSSPFEGQEVNITANIHNLGNTDAFPVHVKFFDGDPDSEGIQIGEEQILHILIHGESAIVYILWNTMGEAGSHVIYLVVDDDNLISETNEGNNRAFKSINVNATNPPIYLDEGWNLVSFPYIVSETGIDDVLGSIDGEYDIVQYYNSSDVTDSWKHKHILKPSYMNDLENLDNKMGFWIHVTEIDGAILFISGDSPISPQTISLRQGWNLVGYPCTTPKSRDNALNNLDFDIQINAVEYFDNGTKTIRSLEEWDYMEPGKGYWIHAIQECDWIVSN
ncbi:MAG: hypothetical protein JSV09_11820 [Thermoplasmata archaeon]|nr:MAG: hypothetical protein JSV09_11820 [Thermoplasmata archaeon]